jgi:hypothetical protein
VRRALVAFVCVACSSTATGNSSGNPSSSGTGGSSGTTDTPPPPPDGCGHLFVFPSNANCQAKLDAACCPEETTCANDFDCQVIVSCTHSCDHDQACIDDCITRHDTGAGDFGSLVSCSNNNLSGDCAWP